MDESCKKLEIQCQNNESFAHKESVGGEVGIVAIITISSCPTHGR
jgi:hypothetical protein